MATGGSNRSGRGGGVPIGLAVVAVLLLASTPSGAAFIDWVAATVPTNTGPQPSATPDTEITEPAGVVVEDLAGLDACHNGLPDTVDETHTGVAELAEDDYGCARAIIDQVATTTAMFDDYDREAFGPRWTDNHTAMWGGNGCDTRNDILDRDLTDTDIDPDDDCTVHTGVLDDPFTGDRIGFELGVTSSEVDIDHLVALSYAWQMGAAQWPEQQRRNFANDPINLAAVNGNANSAKGDYGPAEWTPDGLSACAYSLRFAKITLRYSLPVHPDDHETMAAACTR